MLDQGGLSRAAGVLVAARVDQGLPVRITDPVALERIARALAPTHGVVIEAAQSAAGNVRPAAEGEVAGVISTDVRSAPS